MQESLFHKDEFLVSLQLYYEKILTQESNLIIFKHAILWNTPNTLLYEARQARQFFEARRSTPFYEARQAREHAKHVKHARHASTQPRHLADSYNCNWETITGVFTTLWNI